jgi:hypothetical protein
LKCPGTEIVKSPLEGLSGKVPPVLVFSFYVVLLVLTLCTYMKEKGKHKKTKKNKKVYQTVPL